MWRIPKEPYALWVLGDTILSLATLVARRSESNLTTRGKTLLLETSTLRVPMLLPASAVGFDQGPSTALGCSIAGTCLCLALLLYPCLTLHQYLYE